MAQNQTQLIRGIILSAIVVLVAALGSLLYAETASVKVVLVPHKLTLNKTLTESDLKTQPIEATVTMTQRGTASTILIDPTFAGGKVVFSCPKCTNQITLATGRLVSTSKSLGYVTLASVTVSSKVSATVAVRATAPGTAWNTPPNTITSIVDSPDPNLRITNPQAVAGAVNAHFVQAIQQSDLDALRTELSVKVSDALTAALNAKALQEAYATIGLPALTVTNDHNVGDKVASFTMTMTGTLAATAYSDAEAQAALLALLTASVPPGQELLDGSQASAQAQEAGPNGALKLTGTAIGVVVPKLSTDSLRARIRGLSAAEARRVLEVAAPGSKIDIQVSPVTLPWLPLVTEHITMAVTVQS